MTTQPHPRTPNLALRRARQSMRLSQAQFADAVRAAGNAMGVPNHCTKRLVQKWESGEHAACRADYLRVLQAVTGLSVRELGFQLLPDESGVAIGAGQAAISAVGDASSGEGSAAAVAFAFATSGLAGRAPDSMLEESMDRLRHALEHPSTVDARSADFVETTTARLFDLEHYSPARLLAPTVDRHLAVVTALLTAARHEGVRRRLMISAGRSTLLAGCVAFDRGDTPSSNRFWGTSIGAAEATLDAGLLAATLTWQSYAAMRRGDPGSAWQLAHSASEHTPDYDPRAASWSIARVALYAAQFGEHQAALAAMKRSLELGGNLPTPTPGDGSAPWARSFDQASLLSSTAHTAALLKDPNATEYATQAVDALGPAKVKARAVVLAEAALTAAITNELEFCLDWGSSAATLVHELDVSTAADLLYEVVPILLPYSDTRPVRELLPQLTRLNRMADLEDQSEQAP